MQNWKFAAIFQDGRRRLLENLCYARSWPLITRVWLFDDVWYTDYVPHAESKSNENKVSRTLFQRMLAPLSWPHEITVLIMVEKQQILTVKNGKALYP